MEEKTIKIALPLLLPSIKDERDQCIQMIHTWLQARKGVLQSHLETNQQPAKLCVHYDPNLISLSAVQRLAAEAGSELSDRFRHETFPIGGLETADFGFVVEKEMERLPGVLHASLNYAADLAFVAYDSQIINLPQIERALRRLGIRLLNRENLAARKSTQNEENHSSAPSFLPRWFQDRWSLFLVIVCGMALLAGWAGSSFGYFSDSVALSFYLLSYLAGGYDVAHHAIPSLLRGKFDTDVLMLAAAGGAAILGEWEEGAFLLLLFSIGHTGEHFALDKARNAVNALGQLMPATAFRKYPGRLVEVPVEDLEPGDLIVVRPGDRVPTDGRVLAGESAVDQSPITGESIPVNKQASDEVFAGSVNGDGALDVEVTHLSKDSTLSRVLHLIAEAQAQQSPTQQFTQRFTSRFVPLVLLLTILIIVLPPLMGWLPLSQSFYRAMLLLVAASPCALALGTPAAVLAGIAQAARKGVLIKGGVHLENLGRLKVMAFDKTGTLTHGKFQLTDILPLDGAPPKEILQMAASVEQHSNHPLALAIVRAAREQGLKLSQVSGLENIPGHGVRSSWNGQPVQVGSLKMLEAGDSRLVANHAAQAVAHLEAKGHTAVAVSHGDQLLGLLAFSDTPRPGIQDTLAKLRKLGVQHFVMLTGDNREVARRVGKTIGVTEVEPELLPEHKLQAIQRLQETYGPVAMTGDGVNDAPALAAATVGIAMGAAGTAVALETADIALMADDLSKLPFAVGLSRASRRVIQQNLFISLGVIVLLVLSSVLGVIQLSGAVVLHEGSTILVVLNALRLLGYQAD